MLPPTVTLRVRDALKQTFERAQRLKRTQQMELGDNLFVRMAGEGRKFLLFQLEGEPDQDTARSVAEALGFTRPVYGWHQGQTLRSLTVVDAPEHSAPDSHL